MVDFTCLPLDDYIVIDVSAINEYVQLNPLHSEYLRGNKNIYLHFV